MWLSTFSMPSAHCAALQLLCAGDIKHQGSSLKLSLDICLLGCVYIYWILKGSSTSWNKEKFERKTTWTPLSVWWTMGRNNFPSSQVTLGVWNWASGLMWIAPVEKISDRFASRCFCGVFAHAVRSGEDGSKVSWSVFLSFILWLQYWGSLCRCQICCFFVFGWFRLLGPARIFSRRKF